MEDLAVPATVEGLGGTSAPIEFREQATGQVTKVAPDPVDGSFRVVLPQGRYAVMQARAHTTLVVLPGRSYRLDLRPEHAFDFQVSSESSAAGDVVVRVTATGAGRHSFAIRTDNLQPDAAQPQAVDLVPDRPQTVTWRAKVASSSTPWVAVVIPDNTLADRREVTGVAGR